MDHTNFLIEIGTEELPPKALRTLELAFAKGLETRLVEARLSFDSVQSFATPRRLAVLVNGLQTRQEDQLVERRGPPVKIAFDDDGKPTTPAVKFADGNGVAVDELETLSTKKGDYLMFRGQEAGKTAAELVPAMIDAALQELPIPRRMRWGNLDVEFVRPVHWVVALLGTEVLDCNILGHAAGRETRGHRFLAPGPFELQSADDYVDLLTNQGKVIPGFTDRKERVYQLAREAAEEVGGHVNIEDELLEEVTALVEWPVPIIGGFDEKFLELPPEVLIYTLQEHQRYFPVLNNDGLTNRFVTISNLESTDPEQIRLGNERVVLPRLSDAAFFWDVDRKQSLADRIPALDAVVYQKGLGSLKDKTERVVKLAEKFAASQGDDLALSKRAAELCKSDLLTELVGEFPSLQGRMGYYYALHDGEPESVATAIYEQYMPRFAGDGIPATAEGQAISLADRFDTLAGIFSLGKKPSGSKDPFSLRRVGLGLLRILIEARIDIDLKEALSAAVALQPTEPKDGKDNVVEELYQFLMDRLRSYYLDGQSPSFGVDEVSPEMFESVRVQQPGSPLDFDQRLAAVVEFAALDAAESLAVANKRIANILKSSGDDAAAKVDPALLQEPAEKALMSALDSLNSSHSKALAARDYSAVLQQLAELREPVDAFFDNVMVNADDSALKANRLAMLSQLRMMFLDVADLSSLSA